jgi:DNA ligase (NAD+)
VISDSDYDILFKKHEFFVTQAGEQINIREKSGESFAQSSFKKVAHSRPMISLDNTYNAEDLQDFDARIKRILEKPHPNPLLKERGQAAILSE